MPRSDKQINEAGGLPVHMDPVDLVTNYAIFTLDLEGVITSWNKGAQNIKGWTKQEAIGRYFDFLYTEAEKKTGKPMKNLNMAKLKNGYHEEGYRIRKNGEVFLADVSISKFNDEKTGEHMGYVKVVKDVTKRHQTETEQLDANTLLRKEIVRRKAIEKALKESNDELEAFASAASHELQEPLRMVVSYLQLIEDRYSDKFDKDGLDFLDFAIDGATRMKTLISDLVVYSRIDTLTKSYKATDTDKVLKKVLSNLSPAVSDSKAEVTCDSLPNVWSEEVQLTQVFQNLIANSLKYGRKDEPLKIHIGYDKRKDGPVFYVKDNGKGIAAKDFSKIFLIFKQLGARDQRKGSGVGLALVNKIIRRHKGRIWLESEEGKGSTFYFTLPSKKEEA